MNLCCWIILCAMYLCIWQDAKSRIGSEWAVGCVITGVMMLSLIAPELNESHNVFRYTVDVKRRRTWNVLEPLIVVPVISYLGFKHAMQCMTMWWLMGMNVWVNDVLSWLTGWGVECEGLAFVYEWPMTVWLLGWSTEVPSWLNYWGVFALMYSFTEDFGIRMYRWQGKVGRLGTCTMIKVSGDCDLKRATPASLQQWYRYMPYVCQLFCFLNICFWM